MEKNKLISIIELAFYIGFFIFSMLVLFHIIVLDTEIIFGVASISMLISGLHNSNKRRFLSIINMLLSILMFFTFSHYLILRFL